MMSLLKYLVKAVGDAEIRNIFFEEDLNISASRNLATFKGARNTFALRPNMEMFPVYSITMNALRICAYLISRMEIRG